MAIQAPGTIDCDVAPLLIEALQQGRAVRFRAEGRSMEPFIFAGDFVTVTPLRAETQSFRPGDVLFYEHKPGSLRLHRLSRIRYLLNGAQCFRVRGDAPGQVAEEIPSDCVLGVLTSFEHHGCVYDARHRFHCWAGLWWPRLRSRLPGFKKARHGNGENKIDPVTLEVVINAVRETLRQQDASPHIRQHADTPVKIDARALIALARQHGVLTFCSETLIRRFPFAEQEVRNTIRSLAIIGENNQTYIAQALYELQLEGLYPLIVKGPALAALAYNNPAIRPYDDVDLLLEGSDRARAADILKKMGWHDSRNTPSRAQKHLFRTTEDIALIHPGCEVGIELVHPEGILRDAAPAKTALLCSFDIQGTTAHAPSKIEHFLYCAAHGAKHGYSRLLWLADLDRLSSDFTEADWADVVAQAKARRLTRILRLSIFLTETVLNTPFSSQIKTVRVNPRWLEAKAKACLEAHNRGDRHVDTWRWWIGLQDTVGQRINYFCRWLFVPTGADLSICILPSWAHFAYFILRPLRLLMRLIFRRPAPKLTWRSD